MSFVHGHPRDTGWVMAHRRRPNRAEDGQLPLIGPVEDSTSGTDAREGRAPVPLARPDGGAEAGESIRGADQGS